MTLVHNQQPVGGVAIDYQAVLRALNLNPADPKVQALVLTCQQYGLDPVLKHAILIQGTLYITHKGLLHVAHESGRFDGCELVDSGESGGEWWAKVSVYRKDMSRPFTYVGRYPKNGTNKSYGPEMAITRAECMALRRAFDVAVPVQEEQEWRSEPADEGTLDRIDGALADLSDGQRDEMRAWWKDQRLPSRRSGLLTAQQAALVLDRVADFHVDPDDVPADGEIVVEGADSAGGDTATDTGKGVDGGAATPSASNGDVATTSASDGTQLTPSDAPMMSDFQKRKLFALIKQAGIADADRHGWATGRLRRTVESFTSLTSQEARLLIDTLEKQEASA